MTTSIHQKYSALYGIEITEKTLIEFMFKHIDVFSEVFKGITLPIEAVAVFGEKARCVEEEIKRKTNNLAEYKERVAGYRNEIIEKQNKYKSNKESLAFYFRNPFKFKEILEKITEEIDYDNSELLYYEKYVQETSKELEELTSIPNLWAIFEEAANDAMAEVISRNEFTKYINPTMWDVMKKHYTTALLTGGYFDTASFFSDGYVVNLVNISNISVLAGDETIAEFIERLCNIKDSDLTIRKHIFEKLVGGQYRRIASILHTQNSRNFQNTQSVEILTN